MAKKAKAYELWKQMKPAALRRLALAVFLVFSVIGPLTALMESELHLLSWKFILIQTIASGGMAASIILFGRNRWWVTALVVAVWTAVVMLNSGGLSFLFDERGLRVEFSGTQNVRRTQRPTTEITLKLEELDAIYTQRGLIGACAIVLLAWGYGVFISVIGRELEQRARLETEVKIARDIQQSLLPETTLTTPWYTATGVAIAATEVAGDFFDIIQLNEHKLVIAVADVTGHGVGAGILSAMTKSALRSQLQHSASPVNVLTNLNATLYEVSGEKMFVTFAYVVADAATHTPSVATAGHPPILLKQLKTGKIEQLRTVSVGLGIQSFAQYSSIEKSFEAGDMLLLYTDGLVEATSGKQEQFGVERLEAFLHSFNHPVEEICMRLTSELEKFTGTGTFQDDVSLVCIKFN